MKVRITKVPDKALNAAKWNHKHADGGPLEYDFSQGFLYPAPDSIATNLRAASVPVQETVQTPAPIDYDELKRRQYYLESKFNDKAVNRHSGAMGAYQIMPITLKDYTQRTGETGDLNDYAFNEKVWDYYMNRHLNSSWATKNNQSEYNRVAKALAAYNWGPGNLLNYLNGQKASGVDIYQGTDWIKGLPGETRNYISWILDGKDIGNRTTNAGYEKAKKRRFDFGGYIGQDKENLFAGGGDEEIAVVTPDYYPGTYLYDPANRPAYAQQSVVEQPVESFVVDVPSSRPVQPRLSAPRQRLANVEKYAPHTVVSSPVAGASGTLLRSHDESTALSYAVAGKNLGDKDSKVANNLLANLKTKEDIKQFQKMLVDAGYDLGKYGANKDGVDGKIGKATRRAAMQYVRDNAPAVRTDTSVRRQDLTLEKAPEINVPDKAVTITDSGTVLSFPEYLYTSGRVGAGRRLGNILSVTGNLVNGILNPHGTNATLSEGARRQMLGASLYHSDRDNGKYAITDTDHINLGGVAEHSGKEFRQSDHGVADYISQMADAPYHNIYGQSGSTYNPETGSFSPGVDSYTFNNRWEGDKVIEVVGDGEGTGTISEAFSEFVRARESGSGIKAAIESAASVRGVNVKPKQTGSNIITQKRLERYKKEYEKYLNDANYRERFNKKAAKK